MTSSQPALSRKRRWWLLAKWAFTLAVLVFVAAQFTKWIAEVRSADIRPRPAWMLLAGACYALSWLPSAWFWGRVMSAVGEQPPAAQTLRAYYCGHLGKYVPGKGWVVVIRCVLLGPFVARVRVVALTSLYETLSSMAVGAVVAALTLVTFLPEEASRTLEVARLSLLPLACLLALIAGLPVFPPVFNFLLAWMGVSEKTVGDIQVGRIGYRLPLVGALFLAAGWWAGGLALGAAIHSLGLTYAAPDGPPRTAEADERAPPPISPPSPSDGQTVAAAGNGDDAPQHDRPHASPHEAAALADWPRWTASVALAVVAGFLALPMPGGLGIREAVLVLMLRGHLGVGPAALAAVLLRLISIATEAMLAAVLYFALRRRDDDSSSQTPGGTSDPSGNVRPS